MKTRQLAEILEYDSEELLKVTTQLVLANVLLYDENGEFYELNPDNLTPYEYRLSEKSIENKQKQASVRDYGILIEAHITRIMKRKKIMQKTDLMRQLTSEMKIYKADIEEINKAI